MMVVWSGVRGREMALARFLIAVLAAEVVE